ncbi:hypothetical protein K3495_g13187 [Podosphaera aphanis]|nr:hypothetical protein K3495_g13187 [Podosphaera aphanis]
MSPSTEMMLPLEQGRQLAGLESNTQFRDAVSTMNEIKEYRSLNKEDNLAKLKGSSKASNQHTAEGINAAQHLPLEEISNITSLSPSALSETTETTSVRDDDKAPESDNSQRLAETPTLNTHEALKPVKLVSLKSTRDEHQNSEKGCAKALEDYELQRLASGRMAGERWKTSAIRWAPMNVPLRRRLQTLVVLCHTLSIVLSASIFFFTAAIPLFWPLMAPYLIYCMYSTASTSGSLARRSEFLRSSPVWSLFASYFPARLHRSQELSPFRKYIFGYHPHGIISMGAFAAFSTEALGFSQLFPGIKNTLLTLDSNFRIPFYRDYALALGLASVSRESCENLLSRGGPNNDGMGRAVTIVVGGARESLISEPGTLRLVLQCRKGFVKMALRTGADLVPVIGFGENDLYYQVQPDSHPKIHRFQLLVKKLLGFTVPLFHARGVLNYDFGLMPYRRPLNIVVGRSIPVKQNRNPSQEEVDRLHKEYVEELERMWKTWKHEFAPLSKENPVFEE